MFGEKSIYGQSIVHSDSKGRIILPSFTKAEAKDKLLIIKSSKGIEISREDNIDKYIKDLEKMLNEEFDPIKRQSIENLLNNLFENILKSVSCDKQRRIGANNILIPETEYLIIGCRTSILIKENKEQPKKLGLFQHEREFKTNL